MQPVTTRRVLSGRYELTHLVARGGMAQVYRAHDRLLDRPVALKVLFPELSVDRAFVERFRREAQAAANLSHPNIVPVFDWGEDGGTYFIVMEFIDGQPLSQALRTGGPMAADQVAQIGARVADALAYAHRHGVVHRDVKPGNVLLTADGQVKVTDFGIARAVNTEESLTQTGAVMGTATYFSPEQAEGIGVDARSDIYSLGVVLFEMVAGRPPFLGESPVAIASKHVRERPPLLRDLSPTVPPALEAVIAKAMAKSPHLRYQSASELEADLRRYSSGRPVAAADAAATAMLAGAGEPTGTMGAVGATQAVPATDGRPMGGEERSRAWRWVLLLVGLLVVLGLIVYFLLAGLGYLGGSSGFSMPTVKGKTLAAAETMLRGEGLVVSGTTAQISTTVPKTAVISTHPPPGSHVAKGDHVTLVVSSGQVAKVTVPTVTKTQTVTGAESILQSSHLKSHVTLQSSTKPNGTVLKQTPAAGAKVKMTTTVTLTVSSQNVVVVPGVIGLTPAAAGTKLASVNLKVGGTSSVCSATTPSGDVSGQTPTSGNDVAPRTPVRLTISTGPCNATVPTVLHQTATAASSALSSQGFKVARTTTAACTITTTGKVMTETPAGNRSVPTGSTVTIGVCKAPVTTTPPSSTTTSTTKPKGTKP